MVRGQAFPFFRKDTLNLDEIFKEAKVYSASKLSASSEKAIVAALGKKYNCSIELVNIVDADLISGYRIEINGEVIDSSMKTRINDMKHVLLKEGVWLNGY